MLLLLHRVHADGRDPGVHAGPRRRVVLVDELRVQLFDALRLVGVEHALRLHEQQTCRRQPPDDVGLGVVLLGEELRGDDAGGVPDPLDLDIRVVLVEAGGVALQILCLDRGIHGQGGGGCGRGQYERGNGKSGDGTAADQACKFHGVFPPGKGLAAVRWTGTALPCPATECPCRGVPCAAAVQGYIRNGKCDHFTMSRRALVGEPRSEWVLEQDELRWEGEGRRLRDGRRESLERAEIDGGQEAREHQARPAPRSDS